MAGLSQKGTVEPPTILLEDQPRSGGPDSLDTLQSLQPISRYLIWRTFRSV